MAGDEEKKSKFGYEPNFKWPPERYYNLAAYVLMFNGIANDHDEYGIENSNGDQVINDYIKKHLEELVTMESGIYDVVPVPKGMPTPPLTPAQKPGVSDAEYAQLLIDGGYQDKINQYKLDLAAWERADDFVPDTTKSVAANDKAKQKLVDDRKKERDKYKKKLKEITDDLPNLIAKAKEFCRKANYDGKHLQNMLTNEQMGEILREKYDGVRTWHEDCRKHVKGKSGKKDKDGQFDQWHDWDNAQAELRNKNQIVRRNGWRTFRRIAATALFGGVALASVSALLAYGGFALTAMFGTAFNATGVSGAVLGFIGTIGGGTFAKRFFEKFLDSWNEGRKLRRDRREFMKSFGKYSDKIEPGKTRQPRGYKNIRQRYYESMAIMTFLEKGKLDTTIKKGLKGEDLKKAKARAKLNKKLQVYLDRGLRRGTITNPFSDSGTPLDMAQLEKESRFYRFVTDGPEKLPYGFDHMFAKLGGAKSMNVNDVHSVQAHTVMAETFLREAEKGGHTLEEVRLKLEELKRGEGKFAEDNKDKYQELLLRFSDVVLDTMDRELFENSYNSDLVGTRKDMFEIPAIKERYEQTREGDCKEHAENAFKFIENLRTDTFAGGVLNDSVDASIDNQVHIDRTHMENACSKYGVPAEIDNPMAPGTKIPNPVYAAVQTACANIGGITSKGASTDAAYGAVDAAIAAIESATPRMACNTKAANYLKYMRDKKLSETTHNAVSLGEAISAAGYTVPASIQSDIVGIDANTSPSKIAQIKERIMTNPGLAANPKAQSFVLDLVQSQIEAVERKKRNAAIVGALPSIRENNFHEFKEYMDKIPKDDVAEVDPKQLAIVLKDFKKVKPEAMAKYLIFKLKDKVASILKRNAETFKLDSGTGDASSSIAKLQSFMYTIGMCESQGLIDSWQKDVCSKAVEKKITSVFKNHLEILEKQFLEKADGETKNIVRNYFKNMDEAGFAEYLDSNTPEANWLKGRLKRIYDADNLRTLMTAEGHGGVGTLLCSTEKETQSTLRIYFQESREKGTDSYNLVELLEQMAGISAATEFDRNHPEYVTATSDKPVKYNGNGVDTADITSYDPKKSYVASMMEFIGNLKPVVTGGNITGYEFTDGSSVRKLTVDDAMALMLVAKKRTLSMLKSHMNLVYNASATSGSVSEFTNSLDYRNKIGPHMVAAWQVLTKAIDDKVHEMKSFVSPEYASYAGATRAMNDGLSQDKFSGYMRSENMMS